MTVGGQGGHDPLTSPLLSPPFSPFSPFLPLLSPFTGPSRSGLALAALRRFERTCVRVRFAPCPWLLISPCFGLLSCVVHIYFVSGPVLLCSVLLCSSFLVLSSFRYSESLSSMSPPTTRSHSSTTLPESREQCGIYGSPRTGGGRSHPGHHSHVAGPTWGPRGASQSADFPQVGTSHPSAQAGRRRWSVGR